MLRKVKFVETAKEVMEDNKKVEIVETQEDQ